MHFKLIVLTLIIPIFVYSQNLNFEVSLEPVEIEGLGGLQSYAFGQYEGKWLIIGGRLDGLHQRQPFASFDDNGNNDELIVVDPNTEEVWKANLNDFSPNIQEQFRSTNTEFYQDGEMLYLIGGYAYSQTKGDHITFPFLSAINLSALIPAIINGNSISPYVKQIKDEKFAVTGGQLEKMGDIFYLVGGQRFDGRYNPMGPDHGPGFEQEYSYEVRPFTIQHNNDQLTVEHLAPIHDEMHLRRRDYNLLPQMMEDQKEGLMVSSGVFQENVDLPWLYPIIITEDKYEVVEDFNQLFNHYHCANLTVYDANANENHNLFFGGIAQFYMEDTVLVQDNDVPFVKTIADVTRLSDGSFVENKLKFEMPGYFGAGSEFIADPNITTYKNSVLKSENFDDNPKFVGYIFGGIKSSAQNIFWINDGTQSIASPTLFKVYLKASEKSTAYEQISQVDHNLMIYPNPNKGIFRVAFDLKKVEEINLSIRNIQGNLVYNKLYLENALKPGRNILVVQVPDLKTGTYLLNLTFKNQTVSRKVVVNP